MVVLFPDVSWQGASPATSDINLLWGIIVPTRNIDSTAPVSTESRILAYANTLAHEMGHIFGLGHRGAVTDTVALAANENVMHPSNPPPAAQNLDLIQVRAIRFSEVLFRNPWSGSPARRRSRSWTIGEFRSCRRWRSCAP